MKKFILFFVFLSLSVFAAAGVVRRGARAVRWTAKRAPAAASKALRVLHRATDDGAKATVAVYKAVKWVVW